MTVVNGVADPSERRQKADADSHTFLSWTRLLGASASRGENVVGMKTRSNYMREIGDGRRKGRTPQSPIIRVISRVAIEANELTVSFRSGSV